MSALRRRPLRARLALTLALGLLGLGALSSSAARAVTLRTSPTAVWPALMCTSCHEPLVVAQSAEADEERQYVQLLIDKGETRQQVIAGMVAQYGTAVLAKPPASGFNLTVYVLPPAVLVLGIIVLLVALPKWRARARASRGSPMMAGGPQMSDEDAARLDRDLAAFD